jgi:uncharacterized protein
MEQLKVNTSKIMLPSISQYVLKIASRCNLACSYCYEYAHRDQTWRLASRVMNVRTIDTILERIAQYHANEPPTVITLTLHGGEPLLAGLDLILHISRRVREIISPLAPVRVEMQSNGTLLTDSVLEELHQADIRVGISLDGDEETNDRYRFDHSRNGSYSRASSALQKLTRFHRSIFAGILCVVHPETNPQAVYEELERWHPPAVDLLLPSANWEHPPNRCAAFEDDGVQYGKWLAAAFDMWYTRGPQRLRIRLFEDFLHRLLSSARSSDPITSNMVPDFIIFDSDGHYQLTDRLKSAFEGAVSLNLNVAQHSIYDALSAPKFQEYVQGAARISTKCQRCDAVRMCCGGSPPHRYSRAKYLDNPSVYCDDLYFLTRHIERRVLSELKGVIR